jgi:hypothetical protein
VNGESYSSAAIHAQLATVEFYSLHIHNLFVNCLY